MDADIPSMSVANDQGSGQVVNDLLRGHAPDPQGSAVVFRHDAAHRRGQPHGAGAPRGGDRSQQARQAPAACVDAGARTARLR